MPANTPTKSISTKSDGGPGGFCLSCVIYLWLGVWTALYFCLAALPAAIALCLPKWPKRAWLRRIILGWGIVATRLGVWPFIRLHRSGEKAPAEPGIYVFNHRSGSDAFLVSALGRPMVQCVNGWPMRLPLLGFFAKQAGYLDITRLSYEDALKEIGEHLAHGVSVIDFPEGHRSGNCELRQFRSGIFRIARELGVPLHPGVIVGNERIPDLHFRLRCGVIRVTLLPALSPEALQSFPNAFVLKSHVRAQIAAAAQLPA